MKIKCLILSVCGFCFFNTGWAQDVPTSDPASAVAQSDSAEDNLQLQLVNEGAKLVASGKSAEAISNYFDKVIATYEAKYGNSKIKIYSARSSTESLAYMLEAANNKVSAKVVSSVWSMAFFLKSYALIEIHRPADSYPFLDKALEMSPKNSHFLSELGNRYQNQKNWTKALETYQLAEEAAKGFSPENSKKIDLGQAWRGLAFVYVEQNRLDEAEAIYLKCLELSSADSAAARELKYVRGLKAKHAGLQNLVPYTHMPTGIVFPVKVENYQLSQIQNLELSQPGQGIKISYVNPDNFNAEISVFNSGLTPMPTSATDPAIQNLRNKEVDSLLNQAKSVGGPGAVLPRKTISLAGSWPTANGKIDLLSDAFIVYPQGRATNDNLYIWIAKGFIWKVRVTKVAGTLTSETPVNFLKYVMELSAS
ncbi:Tetratricopeptide repeat [Solimicrobium silvestre]|uniref:Tetratricopeptide repeat n=1 Tax=Solimicrobium silvestre TaxID=2099400 RepID=A0A2S9GXJ0_9BURK|nr:Tetratricopeptide repeat [Solimicrobium silvestre]